MNRIIILVLVLFLHIFAAKGEITVPYFFYKDYAMWEYLYSQGKHYDHLIEKPQGIIIPHHDLVISKIARMYRTLSQYQYKRVILIGPDHDSMGKGLWSVPASNVVFSVPEGAASIDREGIKGLLDGMDGQYSDQVFENEHSVFAHIPLINHYFPDAKIVPVIVRFLIPDNKRERLAGLIQSLVDEDTLVIASIDWSHFLPKEAAAIHDRESLSVIRGFSFEQISSLEIDSPDTAYIFLKIMDDLGAGKSIVHDYTSTQDYSTRQIHETTSHFYISFVKGDKIIENADTYLLLHPGLSKKPMQITAWDRDVKGEICFPDNLKQLNKIKGKESRYLIGYDQIIIPSLNMCHQKIILKGINLYFADRDVKLQVKQSHGEFYINLPRFDKKVSVMLQFENNNLHFCFFRMSPNGIASVISQQTIKLMKK